MDDRLEKLEKELRLRATLKYAAYEEDVGGCDTTWERFKHSAELNDRFCNKYELYLDWLNTGDITEFDEDAWRKWKEWAGNRFPGIAKDVDKAVRLSMDSDMRINEAVNAVMGLSDSDPA